MNLTFPQKKKNVRDNILRLMAALVKKYQNKMSWELQFPAHFSCAIFN